MDTFSEDEINAAFALVDAVKARYGRHDIRGPLTAFGYPPGMVAWAMVNALDHSRRLRGESPADIYAAAWMNGAMVGVALALRLTPADVDGRTPAPTPPQEPPSP